MPKIIINDRWSFEPDNHNWTLVETTRSIADKDTKHRKAGDEVVSTRPYYYATLHRCCTALISKDAKAADSVHGIIDRIDAAEKAIVAALERC